MDEEKAHSEALRLARAVFATVDEIGRVAELEGIDCDYAKGGTIRVARNSPQARRQREEIAEIHKWGLSEDEICLLGADEASGLLNASKVQSGIFFAATAAVDPAKLARGLASVVEAAGVSVFEQTPVTEISSGVAYTPAGVVKADVVVRATEAYTRDLRGLKRRLLPVYSYMVATEPLDDATVESIGLANRPTFADDRNMVTYGQRSADNRIAFGGRGVPYLFGSKISRKQEFHEQTHREIRDILVDMLPQLEGVAITHRWGGVLGIPRNWTPGLSFDRASGLGSLGGYVGEGVAPSNLAGQTMADLILGRKTDRVTLPWVGASSRSWEPEPLRWLGVRMSRAILQAADNREDRTDHEARWSYKLSKALRGGN